MSIFDWFRPKPPKPTPSPLPPNPTMRAVAVVLPPNISATVYVDDVVPPGGHTGTVNKDGYVEFQVTTLPISMVKVNAEGFNPYQENGVNFPAGNFQIRVGVPADPARPQDVILPALTPTHFDPSTVSLQDLARVRGAMWTVRGPWRFGPRPGQPDNITALEYIYSYGDNPTASPLQTGLNAEQTAMLEKYKSYGYTHLAFGPINAASYHGQYPDYDFTTPEMFDVWLDWLQVFWDNGLAPICFLHGDGQTFEQTAAMYDHLIRGNARAQKLMRLVVPSGWEPTQYGWSSRTWGAFADWIHELLPNALILIHTVADVDAPVGTDARYDDNGKPNAEGWAYVAARIHGWLVQSSAFDKPDAHGDPNNPQFTNYDNWARQFDKTVRGSYYDRFHNGYAGWPTTSLWGNEPIKIYAGEYCSFWEYWSNRHYDEGIAWGNRAIQAGADGVLDSCSIDVP